MPKLVPVRPFPMADYGDDEDMEGMTYHDRLEFWGVEVPPNKVVNIEFGETDEELIHLTQARSTRSSVRGIAFGRPRSAPPAPSLGTTVAPGVHHLPCTLLACRAAVRTLLRGAQSAQRWERDLGAQALERSLGADGSATFRSLPGCARGQARRRACRRFVGGEGAVYLHRNAA